MSTDDAESQTFCRCAGEYLEADKAFRLGCDQSGGCPELREAMDYGSGLADE